MKVEEADGILRELWDKDVEAWDSHWVPIFRRFARDLVADAEISAGSIVLDVGTGSGVATTEAVKRAKPSGIVLGIDRSEPMLELAREKCAKIKNALFVMMNAQHMTFPDSYFDTAISNCGIPYTAFRETTAEIFRVLRQGGGLTFNHWNLIDVPAHIKFGEVLQRYRTKHPSDDLNRFRGAVAMLEHVGHEYSDLKVQAEAMGRVGFVNVRVRQRKYRISFSGIREYLIMRLEREAVKQEMNELSKAQRAAFMKELRTELRPFIRNGRFIMEWKVRFTHATKPG